MGKVLTITAMASLALVLGLSCAGNSAEKSSAATSAAGAPAPAKCPSGMAYIPAGGFMMGCSSGDVACYDVEKPVKPVQITHAFCMDVREVTQGEFKKLMDWNPSRFIECGQDCPVEYVPWAGAKKFCEKVLKRLPTEAEWEYAARGDADTMYYWGDKMDGDYAWYVKNSRVTYSESRGGHGPHPVATKKPNAYGLYDMIGNVSEWNRDCFDDDWFCRMPAKDPVNIKSDCSIGGHVVRGGSWADTDEDLRVSFRMAAFPHRMSKDEGVGFRCARDIK